MSRRAAGLAALLLCAAGWARADAVDTLRGFVADVRSGRADFVQTVTSPDGAKSKSSGGSFEFARPNRFRFDYTRPYEQLILGDGAKVWLYDADLNQVTVRPFDRALGSTPAALLAGAGADLDRDFVLSALPAAEGLDWAQATPKVADGSFQTLKVGFKGKDLAAVEIVDAFGQRSRLQFSQWAAGTAVKPERFRFVAPKGADVIAQ